MSATLLKQTAKQYTVADIANFILSNRRKRAFTGLTNAEVLAIIPDLLRKREIIWTDTGDVKLTGVMTFKVIPELKTVFVVNMLTTSKLAVKEFAFIISLLWPFYRLMAVRKGEVRVYLTNTKRLLHKLAYIPTKKGAQ